MRFYKVIENWNRAYPNHKIQGPDEEKYSFWEFYTNFTKGPKGNYVNSGNSGTCGFILCNACLPTFRLEGDVMRMNTYTAFGPSSINISDEYAKLKPLVGMDEASIMYDVIVDTDTPCDENVYLAAQSNKFGEPIYVNVKTSKCDSICSRGVICDGVPSINERSHCTNITTRSRCQNVPGCMVCAKGAFTTSKPQIQYNPLPIQLDFGDSVVSYSISNTSGTRSQFAVGVTTGVIFLGLSITLGYKAYKKYTRRKYKLRV